MPTRRAKILDTKILYKGKVFSVRQDRIVEPGGIEVTRDIVVHRGSVVLLPVFPDGSILLVRQYRHAIGAMLWELVAGRLGTGRIESCGRAARTDRGNRIHRAQRKTNFGDLPFPGIRHRAHVDFRGHRTAARRCAAGSGRAHHCEKIFTDRSRKNDPRADRCTTQNR